jgi:hypothetical protein
MRKWQQDLVQDLGEAQLPDTIEPVQEILQAENNQKAEIAPEKNKESIKLNEYHIAALVFIVSALIFCILKPAIILSRVKDRPEESPKISYSAVLILSACTSALYLGLCFKLI